MRTTNKVIYTIAVTSLLVMLSPMCSFAGEDTTALKEQIKILNQRIIQLENKLQQKSAIDDPFEYWDPFSQMQKMHQNMMQAVSQAQYFNPRFDIKETPKQYVITMDIPGMDKDNIEVNVKEHNLIISGERTSTKEENTKGQYYRQERSFGHFIKVLPLPQDVDESNIDAQYDKGVLTVKLNRLEKAQKSSGQKIVVK